VIDGPVLVAVAAVDMSLTVVGILLQARRIWLAGSLLLAGGILGIASAVVDAGGHPDLALLGFTSAGALVIPLALTAYPHLRWR